MRIAIFGAHKVGKTTLAEELLENLSRYTLEQEPYYQLELSGYEFLETPTPEDFFEQFNCSAKLILESGDDVIFDRCVIDILAYLHVLDPDRNIQQLYQTVQELISEIDLFVFVPIEEPDLIPSHQIELSKIRKQVDHVIRNWIADFGISVIEVSGILPNRRDQVIARISP
ncbi:MULTISPECIES: AAA family ATPase [Sphingobacterium]|uniref:AAA family ATPase n=1 Tax=Sphingobacterium TaxID=28453 RepID=UPI00257A81F8|nr:MULTISPECIES: AAA family ATPase [Sphingobacterium]